MDIYSAETHVKKLLAYVEDLTDSKSKVYSKSKNRLKDIADTCSKVVELISSIIQEEALKDDDTEFGSDSDIVDVLDNMQSQISQVRQFTGVDKGTVKSPESAPSAISSVTRKKAMKNYIDAIYKVATSSISYVPASNCAKLLWMWFDARFVKVIPNTTFRYNMKRFPNWIRNFVIAYGKSIRDGTNTMFEASIQEWVNSLPDSEAGSKYAVPYEIYALDKVIDPKDLTLDAVVMWDVLIDAGLESICTRNKDDLYLNEDCIYNLCSDINPEVLDDYADYKSHPEILEMLGGTNNEGN